MTKKLTAGVATVAVSLGCVVGGAGAAAAEEVTPATLSSQWSFEGDLSDTTEVWADGTPTGALINIEGTSVDYAEGVRGQALHLDGTNGVALPGGLIYGTSYSVSMWLKPSAYTQHTTTFFGGTTQNDWISLVPYGWDSNTLLWSGDSPWFDGQTGELIPLDEWTHVAFTVDAGNVNVYLGGELKFSGVDFPDVLNSYSGVFGLGVNYWDAPFQGDIDELTTWSGPLTEDQIEMLADPNPASATWSFEDDLTDATGNWADGSVVVGNLLTPATTEDVSYVSDGVVGKAAHFDGTVGVRLPDGLVDSDTYSVAMWMRPDAQTDHTPAFFGAVDDEHWIGVLPKPWWSTEMGIWSRSVGDDPEWFDMLSGVTPTLGEWYQVVLTVDGSDATLYLDGVEVATNPAAPDIFSSATGIFGLGVNYWPDTPYQGDLDEVTFYDIPITADAVKDLFSVYAADTTALMASLDAASAYVLSDYETTGAEALADAIAAGEALTMAKVSAQTEVDAAAVAIDDAIAGLVAVTADTTALEDAIAMAEGLVDRDIYTTASLDALDAAVAAGEALLSETPLQSEADAAAEAIAAAYDALEVKPADTTALDAGLADAAALVRDHYTTDSLDAVDAAVTAAEAWVDALITDQAAVDTAATDLSDALAALELLPADVTDLESALAAAEAVDPAGYTAGSLADLAAAVAAGEALLAATIDVQDDVDAAAAAILDAIDALEFAVVFSDVTELNTAFFTEISWLAARGISKGWSNGDGTFAFKPFNQITRDAMAAFLYRLAGEPEVTLPATSPFSDVTPTNTQFYTEIVWMYQEGISMGWSNGDGTYAFKPFEPISRDAIAAFLYRFAGEPEWTDPVVSPFTDVTSTNTQFYTEITWLADTGITTGWSNGDGTFSFKPFNKVTRDAMAAFLYRYAMMDS